MKRNQIFAGLFLMVAAALVAITFNAPDVMLAAAPAVVGILSSVQLKEKRTELENELFGIINKAKEEKREFTEDENTKRSSLVTEINKLTKDIELREKEEQIQARAAGTVINKQNEKREQEEMKQYSLLRAVNSFVTKGKLEGFELEMDQEARKEANELALSVKGHIAIPSKVAVDKRRIELLKEKRASITAGSYDGTSGGSVIQTPVTDFISALYAKNVLLGLGARLATGLVGNVSIPKSGGASVAWEGETDINADGAPTLTSVTAQPHRLGAYADISKTVLMQQGNYDMEAIVREDIINAINKALQDAAIEGGGTGEPTGILGTSGIGSVAAGDNGGEPTSSHVISLENEVSIDDADIGQLAYLTNPKVRAKLKNTPLDAGSGRFVWTLEEAGNLMGYKAGVTTSVPSDLTKGGGSSLSALIFGNFADLMMLQWGGLDIIVDPYTRAKYNEVELVINSFWDVIIRRAVSFAAAKDLITTL